MVSHLVYMDRWIESDRRRRAFEHGTIRKVLLALDLHRRAFPDGRTQLEKEMVGNPEITLPKRRIEGAALETNLRNWSRFPVNDYIEFFPIRQLQLEVIADKSQDDGGVPSSFVLISVSSRRAGLSIRSVCSPSRGTASELVPVMPN